MFTAVIALTNCDPAHSLEARGKINKEYESGGRRRYSGAINCCTMCCFIDFMQHLVYTLAAIIKQESKTR